VLTKQTAAVDSVSGATITSQAYTASLQSALDKAGFKAADGSTASTTPPTESADHGGHGHGGLGL
jgi:major membrane immunogen (membrane-anchored lipoprotein)